MIAQTLEKHSRAFSPARVISLPARPDDRRALSPSRVVSAPPNHGWEDGIQNIYAERDRVELHLIGGIMADPLNGLAEASRAGADHSIISGDAIWIIYAAAMICRTNGWLTGSRFDDGLAVARAAKTGLIAEGLWDDTDHRPFVHGSIFSPESMAALCNSWPSTAMVSHYARQLVEINERIDQAREHLRRARQLIDGRDAA